MKELGFRSKGGCRLVSNPAAAPEEFLKDLSYRKAEVIREKEPNIAAKMAFRSIIVKRILRR